MNNNYKQALDEIKKIKTYQDSSYSSAIEEVFYKNNIIFLKISNYLEIGKTQYFIKNIDVAFGIVEFFRFECYVYNSFIQGPFKNLKYYNDKLTKKQLFLLKTLNEIFNYEK